MLLERSQQTFNCIQLKDLLNIQVMYTGSIHSLFKNALNKKLHIVENSQLNCNAKQMNGFCLTRASSRKSKETAHNTNKILYKTCK